MTESGWCQYLCVESRLIKRTEGEEHPSGEERRGDDGLDQADLIAEHRVQRGLKSRRISLRSLKHILGHSYRPIL